MYVKGHFQNVKRLINGFHVKVMPIVVKMVGVITGEFVGAFQLHLQHLCNVSGVHLAVLMRIVERLALAFAIQGNIYVSYEMSLIFFMP